MTLACPQLAELNRQFGRAVKRVRSAEELEILSRVYWFTIEFGVLREKGKLKAYGTGLLSSAGELEEMHQAELRPLDLALVTKQTYDPTHFQPVLFCAVSFQMMCSTLQAYLAKW